MPHCLRTMPPSCSVEYALGHDLGMQRTMDAVLGGLPGNEALDMEAKTLATLPMRMGGLGFRSAERMATSALWASWSGCPSLLLTSSSEQ